MNPGETRRSTDGGAARARGPVLKVVLAYAVFASLWILVSDNVMAWLISDPAQLLVVSLLKGWLFVAVTSLLLYILIRRLSGQIQDAGRRERDSLAEKLHALRLLESIVNASTDVIFAKDIDDRFIVFNRASERLTGKRAEEVMGRDEMALFPPEIARRLIDDNRRVMAEDRAITVEEDLLTAQGWRTYLTIKGPMHDSAGKLIGMFGIARDITERQQAATAVRESAEELERFNRLAVGRELDMIRLKQQVNALSIRLGEAAPHALDFAEAPGTGVNDPDPGVAGAPR